MKLLRVVGLWGSIGLLFLHILVWACAPLPQVLHATPAFKSISSISPDQWLLNTEAHLRIVHGHFLNPLPYFFEGQSTALTDVTDDLSAQTSWIISIATPTLPAITSDAIRPSGKPICLPGVMDASPRVGVPRLPPRMSAI